MQMQLLLHSSVGKLPATLHLNWNLLSNNYVSLMVKIIIVLLLILLIAIQLQLHLNHTL